MDINELSSVLCLCTASCDAELPRPHPAVAISPEVMQGWWKFYMEVPNKVISGGLLTELPDYIYAVFGPFGEVTVPGVGTLIAEPSNSIMGWDILPDRAIVSDVFAIDTVRRTADTLDLLLREAESEERN